MQLLKRVLFTYRLAVMVSQEDGPLKVFPRIQNKVADWDICAAAGKTWYAPLTGSLLDLLQCPFCLGVWFAALSLIVPKWMLDLFAIAGGQYLVHKLERAVYVWRSK